MPKTVTLESLHDGAAGEMWAAALARVLENIADPNTDHKTKRAITLSFVFAADEERHVGDVQVSCQTKLAGMKGVQTVIFIGKHEGRLVAVEQPRQQDMFPVPGAKVHEFPAKDDGA
jgi:hypothetical protein